MRRLALATVVFVSGWAPAPVAHAADANRPPTPAVFLDTPCLAVVDRSVDPIFHIEYDVPKDDVDVASTEVEDGRTLQFFAFSNQFLGDPPNWITQADVDAAAVAEASQAESVNIPTAAILENNPNWPSDHWLRITADDARVPITADQAALGMDWDTSDVPAGTYVIWAYTWDPARNLWSMRPGAVRVVDRADDGLIHTPTLFFTPQVTQIVPLGADTFTLDACAAAPPGSSVKLEYGIVNGVAEPEWIAALCAEPMADGNLTFEFPIPRGFDMLNFHVRGTITPPDREAYVALSGNLEILGGHGDGSPLPDPVVCHDDTEPSGLCRVGQPVAPASLIGLLLWGLGRRRSHRQIRNGSARSAR